VELRDLIVTPLLLIVVYAVAYMARPFVTDDITRRYFIPGLTVRILGALAVGFIYQFYYSGGDTFNYHTYGSRLIWEGFCESPATGLKLFFADGTSHEDIYRYSSKILFFTDRSSYNLIRIATVFDLLTFSTYSATAVLFAVFSFIGIWVFFITFYKKYPSLYRGLALATLFIPSVFFWGSGLLKDTITLGSLGMATYLTDRIFIRRQFTMFHSLWMIFSLYLLYSIKLYILLNFLPAAIFWVLFSRLRMVPSVALKFVLYPILTIGALFFGYWAVTKASEDNPRYSLKVLAETARITAYDIRYYTGKDAGSGYSLGELDGSFQSAIRLAPQAINVSLFRPYIWEVKNPLMLLSALESLVFLILVLYVILRNRVYVLAAFRNPDVLFALLFAIPFAFAVGVSTFNFGTLVRYKIPLMPFFSVALLLIYSLSNKERKFEVFAATE
jgi:hypothetical protein